MAVRVLIPDTMTSDSVTVKLRLADGNWQTSQFQAEGSYLVLTLPDGADALGLSAVARDYTLLFLLAAGCLLTIAALVTAIVISRKRKKSK
jgi:hypothetical protein